MRTSRISFAVLLVLAASAVVSRTLAAQQRASRLADSLFAAKNYARALDEYERLVRTDSMNAGYWNQLGMSAASAQRYDRGLAAFVRAAGITGGGPAMFYNIGAMHARLGHTDSAFVWLGRAVNIGLGNPKLLQTDEDLASIRSDPRFAKLLAGPQAPPTPCRTAPENRQFDFWVGDWDVTAAGAPVGKSSVQAISGGCALLENWTASNGGDGKSINTYNPITKTWQEYWVGSGGGVTFYRTSTWTDKASISFIADPPSGGGPPTAIVRLTFTALPDGTVRQHSEQSTDNGKTWSTQYDFIYHRR